VLVVLLPVLSIAALAEWEAIRSVSGRMWISAGVTMGDTLVALMVVLAFLAFEKGPLPASPVLARIGTMSYGIYLAHMPVLEVLARGTYHAAPWLLAAQLLFLALLVASGVVLPMVLMQGLNRSRLKAYYPLVFG
jgi:peptidoglycan/LPS O-acetylase OafA/YrhL